jgi:hypothetical protein
MNRCGHAVPSWLELTAEPGAYWEAVLEEIDRSGAAAALLSSEHFCDFGLDVCTRELPRAVWDYLRGFDVRVVCCLRRVDHYLLSWYHQTVKMGHAALPFEAVYRDLMRRRSYHLYQGDILDAFAAAFGPERLEVHSFDQAKDRPGGVVAHLLAALDLDPDGLPAPAAPSNVSLAGGLTTARVLRNLLEQALDEAGELDTAALARCYGRYLQGRDDAALAGLDIVAELREHIEAVAERYLPAYAAACADPAGTALFRRRLAELARGRQAHDAQLLKLFSEQVGLLGEE